MNRRPTLTVTRGLPASGKTTFARRRMAEQIERGQGFVARCNRDEIRDQLHGSRTYADIAEAQVTLAQHAQVEALLGAGSDVIVDDMNLNAAYVKTWMEIALRTGADFELRDEFLTVPLQTCIDRDALRQGREHVGEDFIRKMHRNYLVQHKGRLPVPTLTAQPAWRRYVPVPGTPPVVLVDIDGTVALRGDRSPYDMTKVSIDLPNEPVILTIRALHAIGLGIIFLSGRDYTAHAATIDWLAEHVQVPYLGLFMREIGDDRDDAVVKAEIFDREVREKHRVTVVFDDRQRVVRMWRAHGLPVFQVAEGNF
ncbi:AAA family ATPase [Micromonospora sp. DT227]|uniref:phosphatase domain-containing protein n=1 Tax=Micromonospora sp. DT227 TaxID=3393433 RepID=UPI003CE7857E